MVSARKKKRAWRRKLAWAGLTIAVLLVILAATGRYLAGRLEPFLREQTLNYLRARFDGEVDLGPLRVFLPIRNPARILLEQGRQARARVRVDRVEVRHKGRRDIPPLLLLDHLEFQLELSTLWKKPVLVDYVKLARLELTVPPKGQRPQLSGSAAAGASRPPEGTRREASGRPEGAPASNTDVIIDHVDLDGMKLVVLPANPEKEPLKFEMGTLRLESAGRGIPMRYRTVMTNARPPGLIRCSGTFGPFDEQEPGETPVTGDFTFTDADLGVFGSIAGMLSSSGHFAGRLNRIEVDGKADVPAFRLKSAGNPVPLKTKFHAMVDGTNGNTFLRPVHATLGGSHLICRGGVARNKDDAKKTIDLDVSVTEGRIEDFIRLAVRGTETPLIGGARLDFHMRVPPGPGRVLSRLRVGGTFSLEEASFTSPTVQEKIDDISRRAQGKPSTADITGVTSDFEGDFTLAAGLLEMPRLAFAVPGSDVLLRGWYDLRSEQLDFRGVVRTKARLSQMVKTPWKRIILKPVDPFFAKDGAGAVFHIAITGTRRNPKFARDNQKRPDKPERAGTGGR